MTQKPILFVPDEAGGLEELGGASPAAFNVVIESGTGVVRRRPGVRSSSLAFSDVIDAGGLSGLYAVDSGQIYAVSAVAMPGIGRTIYRVTPGGALALDAGLASGHLAGIGRPIFAESEMILAIAGGDVPQKVEFVTDLATRLGGGPPSCSHICANSSRFLANDVVVDRTKVDYSDIAQGLVTFAGLETWVPGPSNAAGFFTAEANPDPVVAIRENTNEVFVFGTKTIQVFAQDPTLVFAPTATREYGCHAPYSVVKIDGVFAWLDHLKRFVQGDGRTMTVISDSIKRVVDVMPRADDCFGYRPTLGFLDCAVWTFPSDGRTFCFQKGAAWSQWSGWNDSTNNEAPFIVTGHAMAGPVNLVCTNDGRIGELSFEAFTDLGTRIDAFVQTGYINRGTDNRKLCRRVRVAMKRGNTALTPGPQASLRWRDQPGPWEGEYLIDVGSSGDTEIVLDIPSLGVYRRRQWAFDFADTSEIVLVGMTEDYDVLEN